MGPYSGKGFRVCSPDSLLSFLCSTGSASIMTEPEADREKPRCTWLCPGIVLFKPVFRVLLQPGAIHMLTDAGFQLHFRKNRRENAVCVIRPVYRERYARGDNGLCAVTAGDSWAETVEAGPAAFPRSRACPRTERASDRCENQEGPPPGRQYCYGRFHRYRREG